MLFSTFCKYFFFGCLVVIAGCGNDALYSTKDESKIKQSIYIVPEFFNGNFLSNYSSARVQTVTFGQPVKFWASISINDQIIDNEQISNQMFNVKWQIGDQSFNMPYFTKTFYEPGTYDAILTTVDQVQDTLFDTVTVQINTPIKINSSYPANGYNLLDVSDSAGISLFWDIAGKEPWEDSRCFFYASRYKEMTWVSFIDTVKCDEPLNILGPFEQDSAIDFSDTSVTFYWGVKIITDTGLHSSQRDSTEVRSFRTRLKGTSLSTIEIPLRYNHIGQKQITLTRVDLINSSGEIIESQEVTSSQKVVYFKNIAAQNNLNIQATNLYLPEYKSKPLTLDVVAGTYNVTTPILFIDSIAPERAPLKKIIGAHDSISFTLVDQGAGIIPDLIKVILNNDTLDHVYSDSKLSFKDSLFFYCSPDCVLKIEALDYAKNESSNIYWVLKAKTDSIQINGPYPAKELQ